MNWHMLALVILKHNCDSLLGTEKCVLQISVWKIGQQMIGVLLILVLKMQFAKITFLPFSHVMGRKSD